MRFLLTLVVCIAIKVQAADTGNVFCWYNGEPHISYSLSKHVLPVVTTAIQMWGEDMMDVTGAALRKENTGAKVRIIQLDKDKGAA